MTETWYFTITKVAQRLCHLLRQSVYNLTRKVANEGANREMIATVESVCAILLRIGIKKAFVQLIKELQVYNKNIAIPKNLKRKLVCRQVA